MATLRELATAYHLKPLASIVLSCFALSRLIQSVTRLILLPSTALGKNKTQLKRCVEDSSVALERVLVKGYLDCAILNGSEKQNKWLVYVNANGVCWEHVARYTERLGKRLGRKVIVFNYRGVGYSRGVPHGIGDLVKDCDNVLEFVKQKGDKMDVVLWGHSIGGTVAAMAAAGRDCENESVVVVADRSFGSLALVVKDKLEKGPISGIVGALIALAVAVVYTGVALLGFEVSPFPSFQNDEYADWGRAVMSGLIFASVPRRLDVEWRPFAFVGFAIQVLGNFFLTKNELDSLPIALISIIALAFHAGLYGWLDGALMRLVRVQGWDAEISQLWKQLRVKRKVATQHEEDEMIPIIASLTRFAEKDDVVNLNGLNTYAPYSKHMYELTDGELRAVIVAAGLT